MSRCFVPSCSNNSDDNPDLLFVPIPERIREEWCRQVKTEYFKHYLQYCCEEHLNQEDIKNYFKCKLMKDVPIMARTAQLRCIISAKPNEISDKCEKLLQDEHIHNHKSNKLDLQVNRQRLDRIALAGTLTDKPSALQELLLNQDFPSKVSCFVPCCKNAAITCSDKQFFNVPLETRVEWCAAVGKHNISKGSIHICEDHINVKEDLLNYQDWKYHNVTPRLKLEVPKTLRIVSTSSKDHGSLTSMDKEKTETVMSKKRSTTSTPPSSSVGDDDDDDGNSNDNSDDSDKSLDDSDDNDSNDSDGDLNDDDDVPMQSLDKCNIDNPLENDFGCQCSNCKEDIIGFRYTCVQCEDFDLCEACETQRVHDTHYILRIPTLRPQAEVNKIVSRVREAVTRALYRPGLPVDVPEPEIKTELIEETEDPLEEHPNSRPHTSNILEQSIVDIPLKTEEPMDSDTFTPEHPVACSVETPSSVDRDTESTNNPIETKINSDNQPESSECNVQAKWPREVTSKSSAVQDKVPPGKKQVKSVCGNDATQNQLSNSQRAEIADLYQQKKSLSEIARRLKITRKAARLWTRRYVAEGHVFRRRPGSAPTAFTDASERHREIVATFTADPFISTHSLASRHGVSLQTVRLHLKAAGFKSN